MAGTLPRLALVEGRLHRGKGRVCFIPQITPNPAASVRHMRFLACWTAWHSLLGVKMDFPQLRGGLQLLQPTVTLNTPPPLSGGPFWGSFWASFAKGICHIQETCWVSSGNQVRRPEKDRKQKTPALTRERGTDSQWESAGWGRELKVGAVCPRRVGGGRDVREGTHVCPWLTHAHAWQTPTQRWKAISLQLKTN